MAAQKLQSLPGRKTIILITDGQDNGRIANIAKAAQAAHEADAVVYGIQYEDDERGYPGRNGMSALEKLSEPTGGRTFRVTRKMPLGVIFDDIGEEMRNQYGLGFRPPADGKVGEFHKAGSEKHNGRPQSAGSHGILLGPEVGEEECLAFHRG